LQGYAEDFRKEADESPGQKAPLDVQMLMNSLVTTDAGNILNSAYFRHMSASLGKNLNEVFCADLRLLRIALGLVNLGTVDRIPL